MISSQLGRVILGGPSASSDQMSATPDQSGGYGSLDTLLEDVAANARATSARKGDRRPGRRSPMDTGALNQRS
jgi:hypothetical protein